MRKFDIIKRKNLPDEAKIIGFTFLKEPSKEELQKKNKKEKKFDFIETSNENLIGCMLPKRKAHLAYNRGYVGVDKKENVFVEVKSRLLIIILLILIGIGLLFGTMSMLNPDIVDDLPIIGDIVIGDQQHRPTKPNQNGEIPTITFAGYGKYTVSEEFPSVELKNPAGNFVDMVFTLTDKDSGEIIARTDKVPAGKFAYVNVMNFYKEPGVYTVLITVSTFDAETGTPMNGINQKMEVTVK
jgi:hypothetical protein